MSNSEVSPSEEVCPLCDKAPAETAHLCPYAEDINDDHETLCRCCSNCTGDCADDI